MRKLNMTPADFDEEYLRRRYVDGIDTFTGQPIMSFDTGVSSEGADYMKQVIGGTDPYNTGVSSPEELAKERNTQSYPAMEPEQEQKQEPNPIIRALFGSLPAQTLSSPNPIGSALFGSMPAQMMSSQSSSDQPGEARDFVNKSGLSNKLATAAAAFGPNSWGGRLGERVLDMNQRNLDNLVRSKASDSVQRSIDDKLKAKDDITRSLITPGEGGRSLMEETYPGDLNRQSLALGEIQLGDMKGISDILQRPAVELENKAISDALASVDSNASADEQRKQFMQAFTGSGIAGSNKEAIAIAKLLIPNKSAGLTSSVGRQFEDRAEVVKMYGEDSPEVQKFDEMAQPKEMGTFRTLYGPEDSTKESWIPRGKEFIPEKGWTLSKPNTQKTSTIPASKVKQDMNMIQKQIESRTGKMAFELGEDADVQALLLEAQEMIENGKGVKEVWNAIKNQIPVKEVEAEKPGLIDRFMGWVNEKLGPSKPKSLTPPAEKPKTEERISVISPDGKIGTVSASKLEEALAAGYKRK